MTDILASTENMREQREKFSWDLKIGPYVGLCTKPTEITTNPDLSYPLPRPPEFANPPFVRNDSCLLGKAKCAVSNNTRCTSLIIRNKLYKIFYERLYSSQDNAAYLYSFETTPCWSPAPSANICHLLQCVGWVSTSWLLLCRLCYSVFRTDSSRLKLLRR
jgi:hypothetical protein